MHTFMSRLNAIFAFSLSILALLTLIFAMSTSYKSYGDLAKIDIETVKALVKRVSDYSIGDGSQENDLGFVLFNMNADFENCFDWNVKQLFIYLTANYQTKDNIVNQVVLWDHILQRGEEGKLSLEKRSPKYYLWDDGNGLRGNQNVTLTLSLNIVPNAGFLQTASSSLTHTFAFPNEYAK